MCSLHDREESGNAGNSGERVFCGIRERFRLIIGDIAHAEELEHLEQELAVVAEGHRAVVRIALLDKHVAVEAAHLRDGEDADAAEAARMYRQNFTLRPHDSKARGRNRCGKKQIEELQNISAVLRERQTKLKRDIGMIDDILAEGTMTEAHLRMLVEKIYVQETDGKLNLDIQLKAPFRTHLDVYENGTLTERYGALNFDWNRLARLLYGDGLAG